MSEVKIYIKADVKGKIGRQSGIYQYIMESDFRGKKLRVEGMGSRERTSRVELTLLALTEALGRLNKMQTVTVITVCNEVFGACRNKWPQRWKENGWKNAKGIPVKHQKLWESVIRGMEKHNITFKYQEGWEKDENDSNY